MKKGILRSFAFVCVLLTVFTVLPVANAKAVDETEISPRYTGISKITAGLTINAGAMHIVWEKSGLTMVTVQSSRWNCNRMGLQ